MENTWKIQLTDRERKEVEFCQEYAQNFNHGTDGHSRMLLVARLAQIIENTINSQWQQQIDTQPQQEQPE